MSSVRTPSPGDAAIGAGLLTEATARVVVPVIAAKLATLLLIAWAAWTYPAHFEHGVYIAIYQGNHDVVPAEAPGPDIVLRTWDAEHYLALAERGYDGKGPHNAFYPLYPALVRLCAPLFAGDYLSAALALSFVLGVFALLAVHDLVARRNSVRVADLTVLLLCVHPAAFFTVLPYTESLFLLLLAVFFGALLRERFLLAGMLGFSMALARPVGVFTAAPLAVALVQHHGSLRELLGLPAAAMRAAIARSVAYCALPLLGWATYFALLFLFTGDALLGFSLSAEFGAEASVARFLDPLGFLRVAFDIQYLHGLTGSLLDRLGFLALLLSMTPMLRRPSDRDFASVTLLLGVVPAVTAIFISFTRYLFVIFPVFVTLAEVLSPRSRRALPIVVCVVGVLL